MNHSEIAAEIARSVHAQETVSKHVALGMSARQGDLVIRPLVRGLHSETVVLDEGGISLVAGVHGEHRLIASRASVVHDGDLIRVSLPDGGLLVHTDDPAARHVALEFPTGTLFECYRQHELGVDDAVVAPVID